MSFKIFNPTPKDSDSLCKSCIYGHFVQGTNFEERIICRINSFQPIEYAFRVERCSSYNHRNQPSLQNMYDIAWIITAKDRGPVGFASGESRLDVVIEKPQPKVPQTTRT